MLFGADAVEPRLNWEIKDTPLLLDTAGENLEARLSVRKGPPGKHEKPVPRVRKDGKFKVMQVSDLHLSTGFGSCRDAEPPGHNGGRCDADVRTLEFVGKLLDQEKPDLVVLGGDQVNGDSSPDAQSVGICQVVKCQVLIFRRPSSNSPSSSSNVRFPMQPSSVITMTKDPFHALHPWPSSNHCRIRSPKPDLPKWTV